MHSVGGPLTCTEARLCLNDRCAFLPPLLQTLSPAHSRKQSAAPTALRETTQTSAGALEEASPTLHICRKRNCSYEIIWTSPFIVQC
jgi:hypothetical protein